MSTRLDEFWEDYEGNWRLGSSSRFMSGKSKMLKLLR
jgi:hypothetical protein